MFEVTLEFRRGRKVPEVTREYEDGEVAKAAAVWVLKHHYHPDALWVVEDRATGDRWEVALPYHGGDPVLVALPPLLRPCSREAPACG